jgi:hypothetical protein
VRRESAACGDPVRRKTRELRRAFSMATFSGLRR